MRGSTKFLILVSWVVDGFILFGLKGAWIGNLENDILPWVLAVSIVVLLFSVIGSLLILYDSIFEGDDLWAFLVIASLGGLIYTLTSHIATFLDKYFHPDKLIKRLNVSNEGTFKKAGELLMKGKEKEALDLWTQLRIKNMKDIIGNS